MAFTPQDVITEVRRAVQDSRVPYRYDDAYVLATVNSCLRRIALLRPDLFAEIGTVTCVVGQIQSAPADSIRIMEVLQAVGGDAVAEVNRETLDLALAAWPSGTTGAATDWMRHVRNPNRFFIYPPSAAGQQLLVEYARSPSNLALADPVPIPDAYFPVVVDASVWWLESQDSESVSDARAKMFQDSFTQMLGMTAQTKPVTDTESGGQPANSVI